MNVDHINQALIHGKIESQGVLPHLETLSLAPFRFEIDFGLQKLPTEAGILLIRGARQYGKSTWLEQQIAQTVKEFGPGSALYLNGDILKDKPELVSQIRVTSQFFNPNAKVKRLFIDEITAVDDWEKALKYVIDAGELKGVLVITTGSKAADLRHGSERLPGRKGRLDRSNYIFTPISYAEFKKQCGNKLGVHTLSSYILSGGSPIAACELAQTGRLPEYVVELVSDWILGEFTASGRTRSALLSVIQTLFQFGTNPIGQSKLARESGLANNTSAQGYVALLQDLLVLCPAYPIDGNTGKPLWRQPCKYHFVNTLAALCWHPEAIRTPGQLEQSPKLHGQLLEWAVAQELFRRRCLAGKEPVPEDISFWQSKTHEIDFVASYPDEWIEVKRGSEDPFHFQWFLHTHPKGQLTLINPTRFETARIRGITLEDFLLSEPPPYRFAPK
jgi:predicted AAA+ superfamily ATPase